jgi:two-component system, chemotaxis family, chemotaxis protein CheY
MLVKGLEALKVLIVEDNPHMRALLRALLTALGTHTLFEAPDGESGLQLFHEKKCQLILCDMSMKPMDGLTFTRQVRGPRSINPYVPIIMISGYTERQKVEAARDAGVTEFLAKPVTPQNLFSRIGEIVERPRPFVRCPNYFGPDRRRKQTEKYPGPWRRQDDLQDIEVR